MSVLETPRILFRGNMAWDPITTNNYATLYDEAEGETVLPPADDVWAQVQAYRTEAITDVDPTVNPATRTNRSWDPQGTHRSTFFDLSGTDASCPDSAITDSEISAVDLGGGAGTDDPFVGAPARFSGMLVDVEPYGAFSSQLFFDGLTFGIDGGCRIAAKRRTRVTARYINFGRNPVYYIAGFASIVWQTSFFTEDLTIDAFDSPALQALEAALGEPGVIGLTVRWVNYRTVYYDTPELATQGLDQQKAAAQALIGKLRLNDPAGSGVWQPNPARSKMVGVIGLWREGEPLHEPGDRALLATIFPPGPPATPPTVATAFARLDGDSLTIDLGSSIPETGLDLTKQNWGKLSVGIPDAGQPNGFLELATIGYDEQTHPGCGAYYSRPYYEASSGIVTLAVDGSSLPTGAALQVRASDIPPAITPPPADGIVLQEAPVRAIPVIPNFYCDEGEAASATFQVYANGSPGGAGTDFTLYGLDANGDVVYGPFGATAGPDGSFSFDLPTDPPQVISYCPLVGTDQPAPANGLNPQVNTYMWVRRLPSDAATAALPPTWDNVYAKVLANWNALAPCMDNWLDLHDPVQVRAYGPALRALTDPAQFESFRYMPVTRDMTPGQRTLLYAFLDTADPAAAPAVSEATEAAAPRPAGNFTRLSQYTRSP